MVCEGIDDATEELTIEEMAVGAGENSLGVRLKEYAEGDGITCDK